MTSNIHFSLSQCPHVVSQSSSLPLIATNLPTMTSVQQTHVRKCNILAIHQMVDKYTLETIYLINATAFPQNLSIGKPAIRWMWKLLTFTLSHVGRRRDRVLPYQQTCICRNTMCFYACLHMISSVQVPPAASQEV